MLLWTARNTFQLISVQATSGEDELIGGIGKVCSVDFGVECECMLHIKWELPFCSVIYIHEI